MRRREAHDRDEGIGRWVWLLPVVYVVHVAEEAFGGLGLMEWMASGGGVRFSLAGFIGVNLVGAGVFCLASWAAGRWKAWRWLLASGAAIFIANGIWHAAVCCMTRSYIPGVVTGLLLYIPLGCFVVLRLRHRISPGYFVAGVLAGLVIHGATLWIVLRMPGFRM